MLCKCMQGRLCRKLDQKSSTMIDFAGSPEGQRSTITFSDDDEFMINTMLHYLQKGALGQMLPVTTIE
jgi:hypothetical protein